MAECEAWAVARGKDGDGAKVRHIVANTSQYSSVSIQCTPGTDPEFAGVGCSLVAVTNIRPPKVASPLGGPRRAHRDNFKHVV